MTVGIFGRYVAWRFIAALLAVFGGVFLLIVLIDYIELSRRTASLAHVTAGTVAMTSLFRVPQITERLLPFSVLIAAMSAFLTLSRRNELVIARSAGLSAWQFIAPAVFAALAVGLFATAVYNPLAAHLGEQAKQLEAFIFGSRTQNQSAAGSWIRQRTGDGQSILHARSSLDQGRSLAGISVFILDPEGGFARRIEAEKATLEQGQWRLDNARVYTTTAPPEVVDTYYLPTNLSPAQIRESFSTPETVPFWLLPAYIEHAERAGLVASGYQVQLQTLIARPFMLAAMVLVAAAVSLRFFRFGGVNHMVLGGVAAGFLLYVIGKVTEDLGRAQLMHAVAAAWIPVSAGTLLGVLALLFQEDG